jgi:hypothetical protein
VILNLKSGRFYRNRIRAGVKTHRLVKKNGQVCPLWWHSENAVRLRLTFVFCLGSVHTQTCHSVRNLPFSFEEMEAIAHTNSTGLPYVCLLFMTVISSRKERFKTVL